MRESREGDRPIALMGCHYGLSANRLCVRSQIKKEAKANFAFLSKSWLHFFKKRITQTRHTLRDMNFKFLTHSPLLFFLSEKWLKFMAHYGEARISLSTRNWYGPIRLFFIYSWVFLLVFGEKNKKCSRIVPLFCTLWHERFKKTVKFWFVHQSRDQ